MSQATLDYVSLAKIQENKASLRSVDKTLESYQGLVESIRTKGVLNPICLRPGTDPETGEDFYYVTDGLQRFNAAKDAGLDVIPAQILSMGEVDVLIAQITGNLHRIETQPVQYSKQLQRIMAHNPYMTLTELADMVNKSRNWVEDRLGLLKLAEPIAKLVDSGDIKLTNAYALAKLPPEEQANYLEQAQNEAPDVFVPAMADRVKEIAKAKREGRDPSADSFQPRQRLQSVKDVKTEIDTLETLTRLIETTGVAAHAHGKAEAAAAGAKLALEWVLNCDPESIAVQRQKYDAEKAAREDKKKAAAGERAAKNYKNQQLKAERARLEMDYVNRGEDPTEALKAFDQEHGLVRQPEAAVA